MEYSSELALALMPFAYVLCGIVHALWLYDLIKGKGIERRRKIILVVLIALLWPTLPFWTRSMFYGSGQ